MESAQEMSKSGIVPIFIPYAVYFSLCRLYFNHGSNYTFLSHLYAPLDEMQLASHHNSLDTLAPNAKIATHRGMDPSSPTANPGGSWGVFVS